MLDLDCSEETGGWELEWIRDDSLAFWGISTIIGSYWGLGTSIGWLILVAGTGFSSGGGGGIRVKSSCF